VKDSWPLWKCIPAQLIENLGKLQEELYPDEPIESVMARLDNRPLVSYPVSEEEDIDKSMRQTPRYEGPHGELPV